MPAPAASAGTAPPRKAAKLGIFSRMLGVKSDAEKAAIEATRSDAGVSTKQDRTRRIATARALVTRVLEDDYLAEEEEHEIFGSMQMMGLEPELLQGALSDVSNSIMIARANAGRLSPIDDPEMVTRGDEVVFLEIPVEMLKEVTIREYKGGYGGVSFRVAKGVRFNTGAVRGSMVPVGTEIQVADTGILSVTNKRAVFLGDKKTQEYKYDKLVGMKLFSDAITLQVSNRQNATTLGTPSPDLIAAYINAASQEDL